MRIGALPNEVFEVAYLDSGYRLLRDGVETLEEGTVDRAAVYPRRVIEAALRRGAFAVVLAHNLWADSHRLCYGTRGLMCFLTERSAGLIPSPV